MPVEVNGKIHKSIEEAAFGVLMPSRSGPTFAMESCPSPPTVPTGLIERRYFSDELIAKYKKQLQARRDERKKR